MKSHILFISRLILYILAVGIPVFHPAIAVAHDVYSKISLFVLLPLSMFCGYYFFIWKPKLMIKGFFVFLISTFIISITLFPFNLSLLFPISIAIWGLISTILIFAGQGRFVSLATIEIFLLAFIYYKTLQYSRSSEDIAKISKGITNLYFAITILSFLFHSIILYIVIFNKKFHEFKKEVGIFALIGIPLLFLFAFILPPDFIKHKIVFNELKPEPPLNPLDGNGFFRKGQGGEPERDYKNGKPLGKRKEKYPSELQNRNKEKDQGQGGFNQYPDSGNQRRKPSNKNRLEGVPSDQWEQFKNSRQAKKGKQLAVMIIASEIQPVYAAETYLSFYDAKQGFIANPKELLNQLKNKHLITTWKDPDPPSDQKRSPYSIFYLSTIKDRVLAYRPFQIEPTIMNKKYHPFDLSYTAVSGISTSIPEDWKRLYLRDLQPLKEKEMKTYLEINLPEKEQRILKNILNQILKNKNKENFFVILDSILQFYKTYQYKLGFTEKTDIQTIIRFLTKTKTGDCTEFSAATVLLLRLAGIPVRLVHGWIASKELQTPAHIGGLIYLRKKIPYLRKFKLKDLYLVTTAHRHAWIQVYFPYYGWVDIETTSYSIPPKREDDPNARDVVIPLIEEELYPPRTKNFAFPYQLFFLFVGSIIIITLTLLYLYRIFLNIYYIIMSRNFHSYALKYINQLFYMRLYEYGYPKRKFYETPIDYTEKVPETQNFAELLVELKFRVTLSKEEKKNKYQLLKSIYKQTLSQLKPRGILSFLKRIFTLKGIFYKI